MKGARNADETAVGDKMVESECAKCVHFRLDSVRLWLNPFDGRW